MGSGNIGEAAKQCLLLQVLEMIFSPRLWFLAVLLFGFVCLLNMYIYVANFLYCGIRISSLGTVNNDELKTTTISMTFAMAKKTVTKNISNPSWVKQKWKEFKQHDNDVLLEYDSVLNEDGGCSDGRCSKVMLNGTTYIKQLNETELAMYLNRSKCNFRRVEYILGRMHEVDCL